jgi:CRP-like cAMP-binding protein
MMRTPNRVPISNRLLAALPRKSYEKLSPLLEPVMLHFAEVLYEPGARIRHVYFPNQAMVSLLTMVDAERAAEVGVVGSEGMVGVAAALGANASQLRAVVQGTGAAMRINVASFRRALNEQPAFQKAVLGFTHSLMSQVAQTTACNRYHPVGQRLARWLLMTQDRLLRPEFLLTHAFLAKMLGVRRVGVSQAASGLQKRKLITYTRGKITVLDRAGLAAAACSCYETVKRIYAGK